MCLEVGFKALRDSGVMMAFCEYLTRRNNQRHASNALNVLHHSVDILTGRTEVQEMTTRNLTARSASAPGGLQPANLPRTATTGLGVKTANVEERMEDSHHRATFDSFMFSAKPGVSSRVEEGMIRALARARTTLRTRVKDDVRSHIMVSQRRGAGTGTEAKASLRTPPARSSPPAPTSSQHHKPNLLLTQPFTRPPLIQDLGNLSELITSVGVTIVLAFEYSMVDGAGVGSPAVLAGMNDREKSGTLGCFSVVLTAYLVTTVAMRLLRRRRVAFRELARHEEARCRLWKQHGVYLICATLFVTNVCIWNVATLKYRSVANES